ESPREQLALCRHAQLGFCRSAIKNECIHACFSPGKSDRKKQATDCRKGDSRAIVDCVSRRNFLRILSVSAAWIMAPPSIALARLIRRGNPNVFETPLGELGKSWLTPNGSFFVLSRVVPHIPRR